MEPSTGNENPLRQGMRLEKTAEPLFSDHLWRVRDLTKRKLVAGSLPAGPGAAGAG